MRGAEQDQAPGKILIVDDDPLVGRALGRLIGRLARVTIVDDARVALRRLEAGERFDVILCEARLPNLTGAAFHKTLARADVEQARRFVFMTWDTVSDLAVEQQPDGAAIVTLQKPITSDALERALKRYLD